MSWARLDDRYAFHVKIVEAGNEAVGAHARMIAHASRERTDGLIPRSMAELIACGNIAILDNLVSVRLLDRTPSGDYQIHDFLEYNPTANESVERRSAAIEQRRAAGIKGAAKRWAKDSENGESDGELAKDPSWVSASPRHDSGMAPAINVDSEKHDETIAPYPYPRESDTATRRKAGKAHGKHSRLANGAADLVPAYHAGMLDHAPPGKAKP